MRGADSCCGVLKGMATSMHLCTGILTLIYMCTHTYIHMYMCIPHIVMAVVVWPYIEYHGLLPMAMEYIHTRFPQLILQAKAVWAFLKKHGELSVTYTQLCHIYLEFGFHFWPEVFINTAHVCM